MTETKEQESFLPVAYTTPTQSGEEREEIFVSELHQSIREKLDPEAKWLSAEYIKKILRMTFGNRRRAVHKCILAMLYKAHAAKEEDEVVVIRNKLMAFEDERLVI